MANLPPTYPLRFHTSGCQIESLALDTTGLRPEANKGATRLQEVQTGQSEIGNLKHICIADKQIGGFNIPVHETRFMQICNPLEHLVCKLTHLLAAQGINLALEAVVQSVRLVFQHQGETS